MQGKRELKYETLNNGTLFNIKWKNLDFEKPNYFFVNKDFKGKDEYEEGVKIDELFNINNNGIETGKDIFFYSLSEDELLKKLNNAFLNKINTINKFEINDTESFKFKEKFLKSNFIESNIRKISYRPFDNVFCYYDNLLQRRPAYSTMKNLFNDNIGLLVPRQVSDDFRHVFISKFPTDTNLTSTAKKFGSAPLFPLYLYPDSSAQHNAFEEGQYRVPNLNMEIVQQIADGLGLHFSPEAAPNGITVETNQLTPLDILDYIYAVLHSPKYRETYKEFLKIDFPRVPYPTDIRKFIDLVALGGALRQLHLLESETVAKYITKYPIDGDNVVGKPKFEAGKVYINDTQYFEGVPEVAWNFYIGGYQPAQKWLKDRKDRTLTYEDIFHYQKMVVALFETDKIMKEIDGVGF